MSELAKFNGVDIANIAKIIGIDKASISKVNGIDVISAPTDAHTLIATATASASATLSFTTGIDSTYDAYEFRFMNMHPANDSVDFKFQVNAVGQTGFNEVMTTTAFYAYNRETEGAQALAYDGNDDQAQGTAYQKILSFDTGNAADESVSGILTLYAPSSTTYVKHFTAVGNGITGYEYTNTMFNAGYINTTAAIDEISFAFESGNIDAGVIKMYGIATS
jgi:hypothetical protein